jgi:hypothetical protein
MSPDEIERLFEPFYTTKPRGTGLGLTIVARIVEQNGGHVTVTSTRGAGSTFIVTLPTGPTLEGERPQSGRTDARPSAFDRGTDAGPGASDDGPDSRPSEEPPSPPEAEGG